MKISNAESLVMEALWNKHPLAADDVVALLARQTDWQEPTIRTLLNRLLKKGALTAERDGRRYLYRPVLARADYVHAASASLINRFFKGRLSPLVAEFSARQKLSKKDIAELKKLVEELSDD